MEIEVKFFVEKKDLDFRDPKYTIFPALNWNTDEFSRYWFGKSKKIKKTN